MLNSAPIFAYPTEAVYGLGCDPFNQAAVTRLLALKHRSWTKGLILIGASWDQLAKLTLPIPSDRMNEILTTWPGAVTWLFPASPRTPAWIRGKHSTVALRVTDHPIAKQLCLDYNTPLVSTSANLEGQPPARDLANAKQMFGDAVDLYIEGDVDLTKNPSEIRDALTGKIIRQS